MSLRVKIGQHDYTLHVPVVGGLLLLSGLYLIISGGLKRRQFFKDLESKRPHLPG